MSTRCQIEFKEITKYIDRKKSIIERRTIYRHSDGYPDGDFGVISDLKIFLKWDRGFDIEYTPANFIYWNKKRVLSHLLRNVKTKTEKQEITDRYEKLYFGICENDEFHMDLAYFYQLVYELTEIKKKEYSKKLTLFVYKPEYQKYKNGFRKPLTKNDLKLIKKLRMVV